MALLGQKNWKESYPFHSCAGETSKGSTQFKQGLWYFCCCGSGDFGCEEVWSLIDRTWQKPRAQTLLYQPNLWILVVGQGGAEIDCSGEISVLAIPSASVGEMILQCSYLRKALTKQRWWWQKGAFWYTKCVIRVMCIFFLLNFPSLLLDGCCYKSQLGRYHLLMSNPWYWHWSGRILQCDAISWVGLLGAPCCCYTMLLINSWRERRETSRW